MDSIVKDGWSPPGWNIQSPALLLFSSNVFPQPVLVQIDILRGVRTQHKNDQKIRELDYAGDWAAQNSIKLIGLPVSAARSETGETCTKESLSLKDLKENDGRVSRIDPIYIPKHQLQ